ncbi:MAG: hypothetical protein AAFV53_30010 [Myxococcota bacterium]
MAEQQRPDALLAGAILLGALTWIGTELLTGNALEDALITYRYAQNLAGGEGYVFHAGNAVQGTTTPLMTMLLAVVAFLFGDGAVFWGSDLINVSFGVMAAWCSAQVLLHVGVNRWIAAFAAFAVFAEPNFLLFGTGGMETPVAVGWMALSLWATVTGRLHLAAAASALLVLTRIDGIAWAGLIALENARRHGWRVLLAAALGAAILAPWLIWATLHWGTPIPHSAIAKDAIQPAVLDYDLLSPGAFAKWARWGLPPSAASWARLPMGWILFGFGAWWAVKNRSALWVPAAFAVVFPALFYLRHGPRFGWYLMPPAWAGVVVGFLGLWAGLEMLKAERRRPVGVLVGAVMLLSFVGLGVRKVSIIQTLQENEVGLRQAVGEWLNEVSPADATIAMEAIGYQGYYADRAVIDIAGLVSPEVVAIAREDGASHAIFNRIVVDLHPYAVVLRAHEVEENRHFHGGPLFATDEERADFDSRYARARRFTAPHESKNGVIDVYIRRDALPLSANP